MNRESLAVAENHHLIIKKTLQFIIPVSIFSLLYSYSSGFISYSLQFSTLIFSLLAQALDRKYIFLICNGILAFIINSFKFESRTLMDIIHESDTDGDGEEAGLVVNVAVQKYEDSRDDDEEDDSDDDKLISTTEEGDRACPCSSINRSVSIEELNKKIEEFIRKMKKEISVESQQRPLVTVEE